MDQDALSQMRPTRRFSDRVSDYVKHRPTYPPAAIDAVLDGLGAPASLTAADIGAGTGISTALLCNRGMRVLAVEPNADMRAAGASIPGAEWRDGAAEATGLPNSSVDLILCAQAFHWFRRDDALREFYRILRPRARLALVWNARDRGDPFTRGYTEAIVAVGGESKVETMDFQPGQVEEGGLFRAARLSVFDHDQSLDRDGLVGRAMSASYVPKTGPDAELVTRLLRELHARHADAQGLVRLRYKTRVFIYHRTS